ncbi:anti-sigma factor [Halpernia frigidisoli]|uniref:Anti-sigma-K factor RskA n=1 Tax=Halpernia frigidisoli TaxID=1125876 RepID=A0A1I3D3R3_9FLAO|nr:anti-sigma factor [Halpernia frigidisoli]SFH81306.1 Anti-sigma-K factor RskA [Halpernia frigidisoli]
MDTKTYISTGIIEEYALGVLPQEDASILECVMKNNLEVREAVLEAQKTFELLADIDAVEPPSHLKAEIFGKLDFSKNSDNTSDINVTNKYIAPVIPLNSNKQESNNFSKFALIAASLLLLLSLGYNFYNSQNQEQEISKMSASNDQLKIQNTDLQSQNALMLNSRNIKLEGVKTHPGMLANIYWDSSKKVYLKVNNLPAAPKGEQYQLWAIVDGKPVSAGMFDDSQPEKIQSMAVIDKAQAFAITLEKTGGVASPTMEAMYVMGTT